MKKQKVSGADIQSLMDMLASKDGMVRQKARASLVAVGKPAVSSLAQALKNSTLDQVRWEAAKALSAIGDVRAIPSLVKALEDSDSGVTWLAADALSKLGKTAWPALLRPLLEIGSASLVFRQGAHHVLLHQKEDGFDDVLAVLVKELESGAFPETATVAAYEILKRLEAQP